MMSRWKKGGIGVLFVFILSIASMAVFDTSDFSFSRISDGTAIGNLLGGMLTFSLFGLVGYFAFKRSLLAFCLTAAIVAVVSSFQEVSERSSSANLSPNPDPQSTSAAPSSAGLSASDQIDEWIRREGLDAVMAAVVEEGQKNLPMKMNELDQVVSIVYMPTRDLQMYKHIVPTDWETSIPELPENSAMSGKEAAIELLGDLGVNYACSNAVMVQLMGHGLRISHVYHDSSGIELLSFEVNKDRCQ